MITSLSNRSRFAEGVVLLERSNAPNSSEAEEWFIQLLNLDELDQQISQQPNLVERFEASLM
jgi:hypothetical protein